MLCSTSQVKRSSGSVVPLRRADLGVVVFMSLDLTTNTTIITREDPEHSAGIDINFIMLALNCAAGCSM